jgi:signal transduction histidine kinase
VVIAPGRQRFEFFYTGLSFVVPEKVRFKYRLEGLEAEWQDAGTRRSADYGYLSPGDYTFRVIACNNNGVWNEQGTTLALTVQPHVWQTGWFRLLGAVLAAMVVGGLVWFETRRRMRRKLDRSERQRAIERERARIARDIHDDLGASLTRISLLSQSARSELDRPEHARQELERIYQTARDTTRAMDEIVWAVNPEHDTLESLAAYLIKYAQEFLRATGLRCRLDLPTELPAWPLTSEVRHNLFLAFKQALHNVVQHADATEVRIAFNLHPSGFTLELEDNGRGFDAAQPVARSTADSDRLDRGHGLANLRRRLADIGGECDIRSAPGRGTKVGFRLRIARSDA